MIDRHDPGSERPLTLGADKGYDTSDFVADLRQKCVTPHVAQKVKGSAIDGRTTRHAGYAVEPAQAQARFHETIVAASNNPFYLDALRRINNIRRLLAYRSFSTRDRYYGQARDHLEILDLLENGRQVEAAERLRKHLGNVIHNLGSVWKILDR